MKRAVYIERGDGQSSSHSRDGSENMDTQLQCGRCSKSFQRRIRAAAGALRAGGDVRMRANTTDSRRVTGRKQFLHCHHVPIQNRGEDTIFY
jgi:hypothetical protein